MRRLILLRHAKSDWPDGTPDHERPLAERGREAAPVIGAYMAREGLVPDRVLVSSARRTQETWALVAPQLRSSPEVEREPRIYEASVSTLFAVVQGQQVACHTLLMVGHNPGFEDLAARLTDSGSVEARLAMSAKFPTGALAVIDLPVDRWEDVTPKSGRLDRFITPRALKTDG
ncbi:SixA phosphatase family protein [Aquabacter sp. P-9]|uniref:SixA phosphatase family protein n=1 Tax=Aquabacter sediminis TaxID=3029197 RepID=UPI00237E0CF7|nr:histidine phosphatase family protein [Aquabacter sp. P-9]MDE1566979.1 histidine phosphatase family protein [Aquabacter sp. P-9]